MDCPEKGLLAERASHFQGSAPHSTTIIPGVLNPFFWVLLCYQHSHSSACAPEVLDMGLPAGPCSLDDLMRWPSFNARRLLLESKSATEYRKNFLELTKRRIQIHEAYSGMGTAGWAFHRQFKHMCRSHLSLLLYGALAEHAVYLKGGTGAINF